VSSHHLEYLLAPQSLAVIGASDRAASVGATVMRNVLAGGFRGPVWPVNLRRATVAGLHACATVAQLPAAPDLAVICTPAASVPGLIAELGADSHTVSRSVTPQMSTSAICSITWGVIRVRAQFCRTSSPSAALASSCRRRAPPPATSP
jgi:acetyltransferase